MNALCPAVCVGADQLALAHFARHHEDTIVGRAKLRLGGVLYDAHGRPASQGNTVDARVLAATCSGQSAALAAFEHDCLAIGRKVWAGIMARCHSDIARATAPWRDGADMAEPSIRPADERDCAPVARPGRPEFHLGIVAVDQPTCRAARQRLDPQFAQRFEGDLPAVGRDHGPARHLGLEAVRRYFDLGMHCVDYNARVVHAERYVARAATIGAGPSELAACPEYHCFSIGRPPHVRIDAGNRPGFLHVAVQRVVDATLGAGGQILDPQGRLAMLTPDETH